ncbi:hypothetical protein Ddye_024056 [Dipteronia dyeriana]|uniref:Uncharacterized protein n=1 Tax=Dipteronia dyeriana TaxID=168575 RepID=A0AAD9TV48_9ROSI|nr:hypothetical protein Ddye_024056 [Dipteronia dyeriana]
MWMRKMKPHEGERKDEGQSDLENFQICHINLLIYFFSFLGSEVLSELFLKEFSSKEGKFGILRHRLHRCYFLTNSFWVFIISHLQVPLWPLDFLQMDAFSSISMSTL